MTASRPVRAALVGAAVVAGWSTFWVLGRSGSEAPVPPIPSPDPAARPGRPPATTGDGYLCLPGWPYAAYEVRARHYYPPNHPLIPNRDVRPDRCFATQAEAEEAGYALGLPPQGGVVVDGVYLLPVDLGRQCLRASDRLGFPVPCPGMLPNPGPGSGPPRCGDPASFGRYTRPPCVFEGAFVFDQAGFGVPPGYGAGISGGSHLVITAFRPGSAPYEVECQEARQVGSDLLAVPDLNRYVPAVLLACVGEHPLLGGHVIFRWSVSGIVNQVALTGDIRVNRHLLQAIAEHVHMAGPAPGSEP